MIVCQIYASPRREGMYLYVDKGEDLERVPEALLHEFGPPRPAFVLKLSADRKLARTDAVSVLAQIAERGYYLQLPPMEYEARD
jgi:uncharacterized protein YcgL (UPF0745 family)